MATASAPGQYRLVQGNIVPRNSRDWSVIRDRIEVTGFSDGLLLCRTFVEEDIDVGSGATSGNMRLAPNIQRIKTYKESFVLTNYPGARGFSRGTIIPPPIAVMRVGMASVHAPIGDYVGGSYSGETVRGSGHIDKTEAARARRPVTTLTHGSGYTQDVYTYDFYDYGVDYVPPAQQLTPQEAAAAKAQAAKMKAGVEAAKLKFDEEQAENGKDLYQYRMGVRYLKGDGVPSDLSKARDYLTKSAAQGNQDARRELAKLSARTSQPQEEASSAQAGGH